MNSNPLAASRARRTVLAAVAALGWAPPCLRAQAAPTEPAALSARSGAPSLDGQWFDASRQRVVPWRVRWPLGDGPCAAVLYSHGLGGSREGGDAWGEAWRAAGIAVLHLQHPGSDTEVFRGGLRALREAMRPEHLAQQLAERVRDVRFALDTAAQLAAGAEGPWQRLRGQPVGVAGHSFGAHTVQALAGQRYRVPADFSDPRPRAFVAFSPSPGRGDVLPPREAFGGIERPLLAVTGSLDADPFGSFDRGEPRATVYAGLPAGRRALLWLADADHMTFAGNSERPRRSGLLARRAAATIAAEPRHHAQVARVTALWWRAQLLDDAEARGALARAAGEGGPTPGSELSLGPGDRWQMD